MFGMMRVASAVVWLLCICILQLLPLPLSLAFAAHPLHKPGVGLRHKSGQYIDDHVHVPAQTKRPWELPVLPPKLPLPRCEESAAFGAALRSLWHARRSLCSIC